MKRSLLLLGCHVSVAGGLYRCFSRAEELGCTAVQIFTKSQRRWEWPPLTDEAVDQYRSARDRTVVVRFVCAHGSYLYNFASPFRENRERSISGLIDELSRCKLLEIPLLIIHPGAHMGTGEAAGVRHIVRSLKRALQESERTVLCIETTAGQGTGIGWRFSHIRDIIGEVGGNRIAACIDTCHIFAAGYDICSPAAFRATIEQFDRIVGLDRVRVLHLNDSRGGLGSKVDRHDHIGEGNIGLDCFRECMLDERFTGVPKIIETPKKTDGRKMDAVNLSCLRGLAGEG
jgi:deoxyribonuclease-4